MTTYKVVSLYKNVLRKTGVGKMPFLTVIAGQTSKPILSFPDYSKDRGAEQSHQILHGEHHTFPPRYKAL